MKKFINHIGIFILLSTSCIAQRLTLVKSPAIVFKNKLTVDIRSSWQHLDIEKDTIAGTSLNRADKEI